MSMRGSESRLGLWAATILVLGGLCGAAEPVKESKPDNSGPVKVLAASLLGGDFSDEIVSAAIAPDKSIVLAGNAVDLKAPGGKEIVNEAKGAVPKVEPPTDPKKAKDWRHPGTFGFVLRLDMDGKTVKSFLRFGHGAAVVRKMLLDGKRSIYILAENTGSSEAGMFVANLGPDGQKLLSTTPIPDAKDFGIDSNGDFVVLVQPPKSGPKMVRYSPDGKTQKWTATWRSYGDNRPGGITVDPKTGTAVVVGYGMTKTGHEPYKDPYAYGFDREGKQVWMLWNPDPKRECGAQYGGNGLMADTTGHAASFGTDGKVFLMLFADGGNTVCTRDPNDPDKPAPKELFDGVYQKGAGYGFKGASKTSVIFRVDAAGGALEKGTWMCAWLTRARANGLAIDAAAGDEKGNVYVVGGSASGCPTQSPWYEAVEGGYKGGGYLAVFDKGFKMVQCGYFPQSSIACVACGEGQVVIGGSAKKEAVVKEGVAGTVDAVRVYNAMQGAFGGGDRDAYFVVLKCEK